MSKIHQAFESGKAFIAFITCGDPDLETTAAVVRTAAANGWGFLFPTRPRKDRLFRAQIFARFRAGSRRIRSLISSGSSERM